MHSDEPLPKGLDPVRAGRLGLWLLSRRSHKAAQNRVVFPTREWSGTLVSRFARLIVPWDVYQYPGARRVLASICGIKESYAKNLLKPSCERRLPEKHAARLAAYLEQRASQCEALAQELRAEVARRSPKKVGRVRNLN